MSIQINWNIRIGEKKERENKEISPSDFDMQKAKIFIYIYGFKAAK